MRMRMLTRLGVLLMLVLHLVAVQAATNHSSYDASALEASPRIVIILDDLGYRQSDLKALTLPSEITFAILPDTPLGFDIAHMAHQQGRDVMLHMPMQASGGKRMGPLGLTTDMYPAAITHNIRQAMRTVPYAVGVNNHMGSAFTTNADTMLAFMQEVKRQGLFFVDSRTSVASKGQQMANYLGVPNARRQVFLDNDTSEAAMLKQFDMMKRIAKKQGFVVVIGHPYPETVEFLSRHLPELINDGFTLSAVDAALNFPSSNNEQGASAINIAPR